MTFEFIDADHQSLRQGEREMIDTFTTRDEAIQRVIVDPIEASGEVADARATHDVEAIADAVLGDHSVGYACLVDADEFWQIVEQHARQVE